MSERGDGDLTARLALVAERTAALAATAGLAPALASRLAARYYAHVPAEDVLDRDVDESAGTVVAHFELARRRVPGVPAVRVWSPDGASRGPGPHPSPPPSVIDIVTDDMPFLVDSVRMELNRHGALVSLVVHPLVPVCRDAAGELIEVLASDASVDSSAEVATAAHLESFLHFEIARESDPRALARLHDDIVRVLTDVRVAVEDWAELRDRALELARALESDPPPLAKREVTEGRAFLKWLAADHFTFLGYREYDLVSADGVDALRVVDGRGLGILREHPGEAGNSGNSAAALGLPTEARRHARDRELLILTKANSRATVHRPAFLDYVGIRRFDAAGNVVGEHRFLGLYSSSTYQESPRTIPVLRRKFARVVARAGFPLDSHSGKDLLQTLETYPRDELFQMSADELFEAAIGILGLQERQRVRLFVRRDLFNRFFSCLVFIPRERYTTTVRQRIERVLVDAFGGHGVEYTTRVSESVLARFHFVIFTDPASDPVYDVAELDATLEFASRSWSDSLVDALAAARGPDEGGRLARAYRHAFPAAYEEDVSPADAVADVLRLEGLAPDDDFAIDLYEPPDSLPGTVRFKLYRAGGPIALSSVLPVFEHLGVTVVDERPYGITSAGGSIRWIYDFGLRYPLESDLASPADHERFEDAFAQAWRGDTESDGFNRLVLLAGLSAREVAVVRALFRYIRQAGTPFSQDYIESTLAANPRIARRLADLVGALHDPARRDAEAAGRLVTEVEQAIDGVTTLDEDRILRMYLRVVLAVLRTNAYQRDAEGRLKSNLSFKLDSAKVPDLPLPRPHFEIFVCSPRVEAVHLRAGFVARGGLRWSDRREDFRTEVLGLMKAQTVKNAVIVPVGAKGGFVVKQPPADRDALAAEVEACYRSFVSGMLDVTDNLEGGAAIHPADVVIYDDDPDAYLVVAADKGTATFSDVANEISVARGFWLGDAFASGGSTGYDHKAMAITARGAWESVRRHFRELGVDADDAPITVAGIGDMSGDVFGNGMLRSANLKLVAAFDHRHVFVDPDPDPHVAYAERLRLFALPRSSWGDYDLAKLSAGGGVWPRTAKSIELPAEAQRALGVTAATLTPAEVVRAIVRAPVDLLWNGGIGTYVKAHDETNAEVGDKANDTVRLDGRDLRCRVVVEGGNLGFTERGRIEYALAGGRINTDAIDNSAGVDCSDHEVNLKILLDAVVANGALTVADRNELLVAMTEDVAAHVLRDDYEQNQALGNARRLAGELVDVHGRYLGELERSGKLDRAVESLPDDATLTERAGRGLGLTSPELSVLMAYAKLTIGGAILGSHLDQSPYAGRLFHAYFPAAVRDRFGDAIERHPLRREILATVLANTTVNRAGISFAFRMTEETGAATPDVVAAHLVAREVFDMEPFWSRVEMLDALVDLEVQVDVLLDARLLVERGSRWVLRHRGLPLDVDATIAELRPGVRTVAELLPELLVGVARDRYEQAIVALATAGVPRRVASTAAGFGPMGAALDIVEVARTSSRPIDAAAAVYLALGERLHLDRLRDRIGALPRLDRWQTGARSALRDELADERRALTADVLATPGAADPAARLEAWAATNPAALARYVAVVEEIEAGATFDLTTLSVAVRELRELRTREHG